MSGSVISFSILGVSFVFNAYMFNLFIFLWVLYGAIVPLDVWTRVRILKYTKVTTKSKAMREGIAEKAQILIIMGFLAACAYFISGIAASESCGFMCISLGTVVSIFMALFLVTEFSSVLENLIEYSRESKIKANPVVILLSKALGIVYVNLTRRLDNEVNSLRKKK